MRGSDEMQEALFLVAKLGDFVPADHPLRTIRLLVNESLSGLNGLFNRIYADTGRASIAPEKLLRALLLQVFYSVCPGEVCARKLRTLQIELGAQCRSAYGQALITTCELVPGAAGAACM